MKRRFQVELPDIDYWTSRVPCQMACPVLTDAGRYVQQIAEGQDQKAYLTARDPNPLASVCARVCAAPCEDRCRRGLFDAPVSIRALKRFVTEKHGVESRNPQTIRQLAETRPEEGNRWNWHLSRKPLTDPNRTQKVAVIGAGPAGLACAHDLNLIGYQVTVFEATSRAGGMAYHGIPDFRLPPSLLEKEVQAIEELGIELIFDSPLTAERGIEQLKREGYAAFFLAVGTQKGRGMDCPGSDLDGIIRAVDYLININNGYRVPRADKVLVVGGGFVAFDAARMALRASASESESPDDLSGGMQPALDAARLAARAGAEVTLASLESLGEMPVMRTAQGKEEFQQALQEGIRFLPQRGISRFEGDTRVGAAQLIGVKRTYDVEGRFDPVFDEGIKESVETDLVILAIGQQPDLTFLTESDGVELTSSGTIKVDRQTLATTAPGVYAGGDVAFGPRNLIDAVANGKRAAQSIDAFLSRQADSTSFRFQFEKIPTRQFSRKHGFEITPRATPPTSDLGKRTGISEVESVYDAAEAKQQAERCLACHLQTIYDPAKCVLCNRCVDICPENCLKLVPLEDLDLEPEQLKAAAELAETDFSTPCSAMLKDDDRCIRCGLCAIRCPTDAMTMELFHYEHY